MNEPHLRVAIFGESYLPYLSGVTVSTHSVAAGLAAAGQEVMLVVPRTSREAGASAIAGELVPAGVQAVWLPSYQAPPPVPREYRMPWPIPSGALRAARSFGPQVVHAQSPFVSGLMALRLARDAQAPLVFTHHTRFGDYRHYLGPLAAPGAWLTSAYLRAWWRHCAGIVAPSGDLAAEIRHRLGDSVRGQPAPQIRVIPTGLDLPALTAAPAVDPRSMAGWPPDSRVIVSVGRLAREKSVHVLLDAFACVADSNDSAHFLLIGEGPMRRELAARAATRPLAGRVRLTGALPRRDALALAAGADLFAFASRTETQGLVLAEALARGVPVVALDGPGVRDTVRDGIDGAVVSRSGGDPGDAERLAKRIIRLLEDPETRTRMADAAARGAHRFALASRIRELIELYGEVLAHR